MSGRPGCPKGMGDKHVSVSCCFPCVQSSYPTTHARLPPAIAALARCHIGKYREGYSRCHGISTLTTCYPREGGTRAADAAAVGEFLRREGLRILSYGPLVLKPACTSQSFGDFCKKEHTDPRVLPGSSVPRYLKVVLRNLDFYKAPQMTLVHSKVGNP